MGTALDLNWQGMGKTHTAGRHQCAAVRPCGSPGLAPLNPGSFRLI